MILLKRSSMQENDVMPLWHVNEFANNLVLTAGTFQGHKQLNSALVSKASMSCIGLAETLSIAVFWRPSCKTFKSQACPAWCESNPF
jgi:hypothetical protein